MSPTPGFTIAVCTRNRPTDLKRCVRSVTRVARPAAAQFMELLVVDDGELQPSLVTELRRLTEAWGGRFAYHRMLNRHGLLNARLAALAAAAGEVILFLDDDVEVGPEYLVRLVGRYVEWPDAAGIGGVDALLRRRSFASRAFDSVFCMDSGHPGRLSPSGYNASISRWIDARAPFETEYLDGCNMSFRRRALTELAAVDWLQGYSLGEDIYLSLVAGRTGPLWVDPALRVLHYVSKVSRANAGVIAPTVISMMYHVLRVRKARWWNYVALQWTALGLTLNSLIRPAQRRRALGFLRGLFVVERNLLRTRREGA